MDMLDEILLGAGELDVVDIADCVSDLCGIEFPDALGGVLEELQPAVRLYTLPHKCRIEYGPERREINGHPAPPCPWDSTLYFQNGTAWRNA